MAARGAEGSQGFLTMALLRGSSLLSNPSPPLSRKTGSGGFRSTGYGLYELRHFCATHLLELRVSHADVAVQLGHMDGGALVMSTYGQPSEDAARERLKRACEMHVTPLRVAAEANEGRRAV